MMHYDWSISLLVNQSLVNHNFDNCYTMFRFSDFILSISKKTSGKPTIKIYQTKMTLRKKKVQNKR